MRSSGIIELALVAMLGLNALAILLTVGNKVLRSARQREEEARASKMYAVLDDFLPKGRVSRRLRRLRPREMDALATSMVEYLAVLRGSGRERMLHLAEEAGLVERYLGMLRSGRRWRGPPRTWSGSGTRP